MAETVAHGGPMLEQIYSEGQQPMEKTHTETGRSSSEELLWTDPDPPSPCTAWRRWGKVGASGMKE